MIDKTASMQHTGMPVGGSQEVMSARLKALVMRILEADSLDRTACVSARARHGIFSMNLTQPAFSLVLQGEKQVRHGDRTLIYRPGDLLVVSGGVRVDLLHVPDAETGRYLTLFVPLCAEVLSAARIVWGEPVPVPGDMRLGHFAVADFERQLLLWAEALLQDDYPSARVALVSLLVDMCRQGMGSLLVPPPETLSTRIHAMVAEQPARAWQSRDFEQHFNRSAATLRRHLAAEGSSLRALIADARLHVALDMLYTTRLPVKTVAQRVGYQSAESFSRAFRERYGTDPSFTGNG